VALVCQLLGGGDGDLAGHRMLVVFEGGAAQLGPLLSFGIGAHGRSPGEILQYGNSLHILKRDGRRAHAGIALVATLARGAYPAKTPPGSGAGRGWSRDGVVQAAPTSTPSRED